MLPAKKWLQLQLQNKSSAMPVIPGPLAPAAAQVVVPEGVAAAGKSSTQMEPLEVGCSSVCRHISPEDKKQQRQLPALLLSTDNVALMLARCIRCMQAIGMVAQASMWGLTPAAFVGRTTIHIQRVRNAKSTMPAAARCRWHDADESDKRQAGSNACRWCEPRRVVKDCHHFLCGHAAPS